ncbi:MAG TPA: winged helix-turn-helix domain-containing protein [Terriglobales bacterium]|nr:winged helix-turn-helix domain-containing protein [Terriglobales bacterium]
MSIEPQAVVRFGVFEADLRAGELRKTGELRKKGVRVKIQDLPFRTLKLLLSRPNEIVTRDEFRQALWPQDIFVDFDRGISSAIKRLRDALGDSADNPIFIETIERRGYRWIAPTQIPSTHTDSLPEAIANGKPELPDPAAGVIPSPANWKPVLALSVLAALFLLWTFWRKHDAGRDQSPKASTPQASSSTSSSPSTLPSGAATSSSRPPANREAEEFYLKGRYYWEKRTPESLNKAVDSFTQAIVHDPNYAPAYVGLADCYNLLREYTVMPSSEAYPRAMAAAKKAVELDPQSSEAHASLAFVSFFGMTDTGTADREFLRAIELNPNNSIAHHWYASYLMCMRRFPESLAEIERAQALDPASKSVLADKGILLFDAGRQQEAIALLKQMEENEPDFISPHRFLKEIYLITADYPHYLVEARKEAMLVHDASALAVADATERGFARGGAKGLLDALVLQQQKLYDRGRFSPLFLAATYSVVGNKQKALDYLKIAYDQHSDGVVQMASMREFDHLHGDPTFQKMLADVGLPPIN